MARKLHEISFAIAGKIMSTFQSSFAQATGRIRDLGNTAKSLKDQIKRLEQDYKNGTIAAEKYAAAHQKLTKQLDAVLARQKQLSQAQAKYNEIQGQQSQLAGQFAAVGVAASPFAIAVTQAMAFEDAMLGVARQVEGARDQSGKLTAVYYDMAKRIQQVGHEIPIATNEIADMVTAGARMGVAREALIGFTRTAAMMATAFDAPAGELAEKMGKVATNFKIPVTAVNELADSINFLDDNAISKGADIIEVLNRISGTAQQVGMSAKDAAALASTFLTTGSSAEVAATAANAMMRELAIATKQPARFQEGLEALGMTASEVQNGMAKDATGTIQKVLAAINKLPKEQQTAVTVQLFGKEYGDDAARLAQNIEEFRRQLALASGEAAKGSMSREFAARMQNTSAQLQILKNKMAEVGASLGSSLLPMLNDAFSKIGSVAVKVAEWAKANPEAVKTIIQLAIALGSARVAFLTLNGVINGVRAATLALNMAMAANPIGLIVIAVSTLIGTLVYLYQTNETVRKGLNNLFARFKQYPEMALSILGPVGAIIAAGITLYRHWDDVQQYAADLWVSINNHFASGVNKAIAILNPLITAWNKLTGASIAHIPEIKMDYSVQIRKMNERKAMRNMGVDGSHATGREYVPHDGYLALLHRGEGVLTARENRDYLSLKNSSSGATFQFVYSPTIQANDASGVSEVLQQDKRSFEKQANEWMHQQRRLAFS